MLASTVITDANRRMGDAGNKVFSNAEKLAELNKLLQVVASRTGCFKKQYDIQIQDQQRIYTLPSDLLQLLQVTVEVIDGELIFSSNYQALFNSGRINGQPFSTSGWGPGAPLGAEWINGGNSGLAGLTSPASVKVRFSDLVSHNEIMIDPLLTTGNVRPVAKVTYNFGSQLPQRDLEASTITVGTIYEQAAVPDEASENDIWIDTDDADKPRAMYRCTETYDDQEASPEDMWTAVTLRLVYASEFSDLQNDAASIPAQIQPDLRDALADGLAAALLEMDEGGDRNLADRLQLKFERALQQAIYNRSKQAFATLIPG